MVCALSATPTTSNGRVFYRVQNLTDPEWADGGEFFWDSLYTRNLGVANFTQARFGKIGTFDISSLLTESPGWESITVNPAHVSPTEAKAYFADAPGVPDPASPSPVVLYDGTGFVDLDVYSYDGAAFVPVEAP